jgi:hypothetical protein
MFATSQNDPNQAALLTSPDLVTGAFQLDKRHPEYPCVGLHDGPCVGAARMGERGPECVRERVRARFDALAMMDANRV